MGVAIFGRPLSPRRRRAAARERTGARDHGDTRERTGARHHGGTRERTPARHHGGTRGPSFAILILLSGLSAPPARSADVVSTDDDWSHGRYVWSSGADADAHPGLLIPLNDPQTMRFVAEVTSRRGVYAMATYHDTLFLGACEYPITVNGADILSYDYRTGDFALAYQPDEQGLTTFHVSGDTLFVPGPDTYNGYLYGSAIYLYNGRQWIKKQTVPLALHLFDLTVLDGAIYVATGDQGLIGSVRKSTDWGETWSTVLALNGPDVRRFYAVGRHQGRLYAQHDGLAPETNRIYVHDGTSWSTITTPGLPTAKMGTFTAWGDSLFLNIGNRMYIIRGTQVYASWMPFSGDRWCRGFHIYKGIFYGGADQTKLYRWTPGSTWTQVCQFGLTPDTEELSVMATYYGRLYIATARHEGYQGGRLYVSAAAPLGRLMSEVHDFGAWLGEATLSWVDFRPSPGNTTRFRVRSGATEQQAQSAPFLGPDGTPSSYYETSGTLLPPAHHGHRYFQYLVDLLCPGGLEMPFLDQVTLAGDTLDVAAVSGNPPDLPDGGARTRPGARLTFDAPEPNPARHGVTVTVRWETEAPRADMTLRMRVVDLQGRVVREARWPSRERAVQSWRWDLTDRSGRPVPSGIYRVQADLGPGANAPVTARSLLVVH